MLENSRVILLPLDPNDISHEYVGWFNDPLTFRYLGTKFGQTHASIKAYVESIKPPNMICKIFDAALPRRTGYVGNIALSGFDPIHRRMEIGIVIGDVKARGKGIGKHACSLLIQYVFDHLNVHKITAGTVDDNKAMDKVFRDLGFSLEGTLHEHWYTEGEYHDMYRYGLLKDFFMPVK